MREDHHRLEGVGDELGDDPAAGAGEAIDEGVGHAAPPATSPEKKSVDRRVERRIGGGGWLS